MSHRAKSPSFPRHILLLALGLSIGLFGACTLTKDDFDPVQVDVLQSRGATVLDRLSRWCRMLRHRRLLRRSHL